MYFASVNSCHDNSFTLVTIEIRSTIEIFKVVANKMGMMNEFKEFAVKGNVMDVAVGIIIGAAFGKIVSSFVADVVMPPIGLLMGGVDFTKLAYTLQAATGEVEAITIKYGAFAQTMLDFIIIAFAVFMMVKSINSMKKQPEEAPEAPPEPSKEEILLIEIRDALRNK